METRKLVTDGKSQHGFGVFQNSHLSGGLIVSVTSLESACKVTFLGLTVILTGFRDFSTNSLMNRVLVTDGQWGFLSTVLRQ